MIAKRCLLVTITFSFLALPSLIAQQRVLLHINKEGQQEAIPIRKGERAENVLSRLNKRDPSVPQDTTGVRDSLTNFGKTGATNFNALHQDVMFQWFDPQAPGIVLEFGWKNGYDIGVARKSTIRMWNADKRLLTLPENAQSTSGTDVPGNMGYYQKADDGDGFKTPFKDEATDTSFVGGLGDSTIRFDPLGKEARWSKGGHQFSLTPSTWQSFRLLEWGDTVTFHSHEPIGFTKQNDTRISDLASGQDTNMLIGANSADAYPFHSLKFYEGTPTSNYGWQIRNYEWNFYLIVSYTSVPPPKFNFYSKLGTTLKTTPRTVTAVVTAESGVQKVELYFRINNAEFTKTAMTNSGATYTGTLPAANPGDTVQYFLVATDVNNLSNSTPRILYTIFKVTKNYLYIWNGRSLPSGISSASTLARYGMMKDSVNEPAWYDVWDVKRYGTGDIPDLLINYIGVVEGTGDGGWADLTGYAAGWLSTGTPQNPKVFFLSDQDQPWILGSDTAFSETHPLNEYFGLFRIANQDYPYPLNGDRSVTTPWKIDVDSSASANSIFSFINKYQNDNGVTLWYHPNYEWPPFLNWMDGLQPKAEAKVIFRDLKYNQVIGVRKSAPDNSWHTTFLAFDYLGCNFRSDTSTLVYATPDKDPKYKRLIDVGSLAANFVETLTAVPTTSEQVPIAFSLNQNYPNPFNPSTHFRFTIANFQFVQLKVFDLLGREVATLVNEQKPAGSYTVRWDATHFASGVYFYRLQAGNFSDTKKLLLLK